MQGDHAQAYASLPPVTNFPFVYSNRTYDEGHSVTSRDLALASQSLFLHLWPARVHGFLVETITFFQPKFGTVLQLTEGHHAQPLFFLLCISS